jgi:hypothetical protein
MRLAAFPKNKGKKYFVLFSGFFRAGPALKYP